MRAWGSLLVWQGKLRENDPLAYDFILISLDNNVCRAKALPGMMIKANQPSNHTQ